MTGKWIFLLLLLAVFTSCVRQGDITSYKSGDADHIIYNIDTTQQYKLIKGDKVGVQVINNTGEEVDVFNKQATTSSQGGTSAGLQLQGYDVDQMGFVDLPLIGKIHVEGKTLFEVDSLIENRLSEYLAFAYVKTVLMSYRITLLGEFRAPQTIANTYSEINILQGIGMAGDFTEYADRANVKVYRKNGRGVYEMYKLNFSNDALFSASQFMLLPNDVIYAPPLKAKVLKLNAPTVSLILSVFTFTLVVLGYAKIL